jgi:uncharacterized protein (TIGR02996 family)
MNHERPFLDDIIENPDDDAPRLIYADWLEDHAGKKDGRPERAELIRAQIELKRLWPDYAGYACNCRWMPGFGEPAELGGRIRPLWQRVEELAPRFAPRPRWGLRCWCLRGGFLERVGLVGCNLRHAEAVFASNPVRQASAVRMRGHGAALASCPQLARLQHLEVGEADPTDLDALAASPYLNRLEWLGLHCGEVPSALRFLTSAKLSAIAALIIGRRMNWQPQEEGPGLRLELPRRVDVTPAEFARLVSSPALAGLRELRMAFNRIEDQGFRTLARAPHLANLCHLELPAGGLSRAGLEALLAAPWAPQMRTLHLWGGSELEPADVQRLLGAAQLAELRSLRLDSTRLGMAEIRILASSGHLARLTDLMLWGCELGDAEAQVLAASPYLGSLTRLDLRQNRIGRKGAAALRQRFANAIIATDPAR